MPDFYKVRVKQQTVFHDGTSMIVLKPKSEKDPAPKNPEVAERFIARLVADGSIEAPKGWEAPEVVDDGGVPVATADGGATFGAPEDEAKGEEEVAADTGGTEEKAP